MTGDELAAIRERVEAATPGPWAVPGANVFRVIAPEAEHHNPTQGRTSPYPWRVICDAGLWDMEAADIDFIAHARTDVPALLAEVDRQRRIISMLADACQASGMADVDRMRDEYERTADR